MAGDELRDHKSEKQRPLTPIALGIIAVLYFAHRTGDDLLVGLVIFAMWPALFIVIGAIREWLPRRRVTGEIIEQDIREQEPDS